MKGNRKMNNGTVNRIPKDGDEVYILAGCMADIVVKGKVLRTNNIDNKWFFNTYLEIENNNGGLHHVPISVVFDHKPKRVKITDTYGEVIVWQ